MLITMFRSSQMVVALLVSCATSLTLPTEAPPARRLLQYREADERDTSYAPHLNARIPDGRRCMPKFVRGTAAPLLRSEAPRRRLQACGDTIAGAVRSELQGIAVRQEANFSAVSTTPTSAARHCRMRMVEYL